MDDDIRALDILLVQEQLKELVQKHGMRYVSIAIEMGCSEESVRAWYRGQRCANDEFRTKILILLEEVQKTGVTPKKRFYKSFYGRKRS